VSYSSSIRGALCALAIAVLACTSACTPAAAPRAEDGKLDLSNWDFAADGDVALLGTWEICWGQLLVPGQACPTPWQPALVRGLWSEEALSSPFGGRGVATYRLEIKLPPDTRSLSLAAGGPHTAHVLFVDGVEIGGDGVVGTNSRDTVTGVHQRVHSLPSLFDEVGFLVQVANFEFRGGGLKRIWYLGEPHSIQRGRGLALIREGSLFVVGTIVGLLYLMLFALGPSERARGYFGLFSLTVGLRAIPSSISGFGDLFVPWAAFQTLTRAEYLATSVLLFAAIGYIATKVPGLVSLKATKGVQLVALALAAIVVFAPFDLVLETILFQYVLALIILGTLFVGYRSAAVRGVPGVRVTVIAGSIYLCAVGHDLVRQLQSELGAPIELYPYAMLIWILAEGTELMRRFYQTFSQVEILSEELTEANFELQEAEAAIVRFVPIGFLKALGKKSIHDVQPGDQVEAEMSVLHCTLKLSDGPPSSKSGRNFEMVQRVVEQVEAAIRHRGGFVNEVRDDGFEALFPAGADAAVSAGIEISAAVHRRNTAPASNRGSDIAVTIGIDTGRVRLSTIGSRDQLLRAIDGSAVDGARQVEAAARASGATLLISEKTTEGLGGKGKLTLRLLDQELAGSSETKVFEVELLQT
jgi:adenylate cyclase